MYCLCRDKDGKDGKKKKKKDENGAENGSNEGDDDDDDGDDEDDTNEVCSPSCASSAKYTGLLMSSRECCFAALRQHNE